MTKPALMETGFLRGKLAKRVFMLFVASALVPILILAALYQFQGSTLLLEHAQGQLRGTSVTYGTAIYDRLVLADEALRGVAREIVNGTPFSKVRSAADATFTDLKVVPYDPDLAEGTNSRALPNLPSGKFRQHLLKGGSTLVSKPRRNQQAKVFMMRLADPGNPVRGLVLAEISGQYLWAERDANPYLTELCVFDQRYLPLSCTQAMDVPGLPAALAKNATGITGNLDWTAGDDAFVGNFREVFLDAKFNVPRWIVVATQRKSDALGSLKTFETIFWGSLCVSALLAILLSSIQIRRTMIPLEKLIHGTSQLGNKDFSTKVEISSNDEFQTLAQSFNNMATRLGRQFEVMTTLSSIDRAILYELDIDRVMEEVLLSLRAMYDIECAGTVVMDRELSDMVHMFSITSERDRPMTKRKHESADTRDMLMTSADGYWATFEELGWRGMACRDRTNARHFFSFPIASKAGPGGQLMLGFENRIEFDEDDISYIREFSDRIGVALASAARDEQLFRQARYDGLTGLPNRFLLIERLKQEVAQAHRTDKSFALLYVDLDRFKQVNDSLGHSAGDLLLQEAAHRLRECVRESDTVARVGGDEFTILLTGINEPTVSGTVAEHILTAMEQPFTISGTENFVSASIGIAVYPQDGNNPSQLLRNADTAMYRAKTGGRASYVYFEDGMNAEVVRIAKLDRELRHALAKQQLLLHYQPQIDLKTGAICAVEALVRWEHPQRGELKPGHFVDFAEDSGLIVALGEFVLKEACRQYGKWRDIGIDVGRIAINVSGRQFRQPGFTDSIEQILKSTGTPGTALTVEITENVLIDDIDQVVPSLSRLKRHGIRIELDDFGTGYSSMSYLEKLPVDTLKIDRSFVRTIDAAGRGGVIAKLVLDMARALRMKVVAEGVERLEHLQFLRDHECDIGQGFLFSKPLPADSLTQFITTWNLREREEFFPGTGQPRISIVH